MLIKSWKKDVQSSLVVFLVALPLCLGIALASNAPLSAGLYAGIIGGLVVGSISGSHVSVSGPAAGLTVICAAAIHNLGSFQAFTLAVFLSGIIQIIFGFLRGGAIGDYFPSSVVKGMLAAIGLILIFKQFPHAISHRGAFIVAMLSLAIMLVWEKLAKTNRFFQLIPGALVAVLSSIGLNYIFTKHLPAFALSGEFLVNLPFEGGMDDFLRGIRFPEWEMLKSSKLYVYAFTIAIVGSLESLLSVDASDKLDEEARVTNKNRELLAQGVGNAISGLIGGLPITAVIVRSTANITAGAKTKGSAVYHGMWLLLCVIFIPHFLNQIPLACLASVLLLVGYKLTKPELIKKMYNKGMNQFIPFAVTIIAIFFTNLLLGIAVGFVVGFIFVIRSNIHQSIVMVEEGTLYLIKFYKDVSFLQKSTLSKLLEKIPDGSSVVLDGSSSIYLDEDIQEMLEEFMRRGMESGINVELKKSSLALCPMFKEN